MPFDGNGNWTSNFSAEADRDAGYKILASRFDNIFIADIAAGLSNCVTRDGQGIMQTNTNANNYRVVNVADPLDDKDAVNLDTANAKDALCVHLDGEETITGDKTFTGNCTFAGMSFADQAGKSAIIDLMLPDYTAGVSISTNGGEVPSNGLIIARKFTIDDYWYVSVNKPVDANDSQIYGGGSHNQLTSASLFVSAGDKIYASNGVTITFYPCKGEQDAEILESS